MESSSLPHALFLHYFPLFLFFVSFFECRASRLSLVVWIGVFFEGGLYIRIFGILPCSLLDKLKANKLKARKGMRHARARHTFDLACAVPDSGGVAARRGSPSRACEGSSSRFHAVTKLLQLDASDTGGRSATWRRGAARKVDSLGRLRGPPRGLSLSPPFFSVAVT